MPTLPAVVRRPEHGPHVPRGLRALCVFRVLAPAFFRSRPSGSALAVLMAGAVAAGAALDVSSLAAQEGLEVGARPEAVVIETLDGAPADLGEVMGSRPVLVEFWATWCAICRALEPRVAEAHERYGDEVDFLVVAIAVSQTQAQVRQHMERHGVTGRVLWDTRGRATRAFDAPGTGYVVVLDAEGRVAYTGTGGDQDLTGAVARALRR